MRFLFVLILLAGIGVGAVYPWGVRNFSGHEVGSWRVADQGAFRPVNVKLAAGDAPLQVLVDLTTSVDRLRAFDRTILSITATHDGATVLSGTLNFSASPSPRQQSPQSGDYIFRDSAGPIGAIGDGSYIFTVRPGNLQGIPVKTVDLILRKNAVLADERAGPVGLGLAAVGLIGMVLTFRRGARPGNPNSQPPPPRWGRGGAAGR